MPTTNKRRLKVSITKSYLAILLLLVLSQITGCTIGNSKVDEVQDIINPVLGHEGKSFDYITMVKEDELFRITVYINKLTFATDEEIKLHGTLEYIGPNKQIKVTSGIPYFGYEITKESEYFNQLIIYTINVTHTFGKGLVYPLPFAKSGPIESEGKYTDEIRAYHENAGLSLSKGTYEITAKPMFTIVDDNQNNDRSTNRNITFTITVK